MIARVLIWLLIVVVAMFTYPGELIASLATRLTPAPVTSTGPAGALPWLHVAHPSGQRPYIADEQGRLTLLHGAIPASLLEFGPGSGPIYPLETAAYKDGQCPANSFLPSSTLCRGAAGVCRAASRQSSRVRARSSRAW